MNFSKPNCVTIETVSVRTDDDIEFDLIKREIGHVAAEIPVVTSRTKHWSRNAERKAFLCGNCADALQTFTPNRLLVHQRVVFRKARREHVEKTQHTIAPTIGKVSSNASGTDVIVIHPQAGYFLKEAKRFFSLAPAVEHHGNGTEIHAVCRHKK